MTKKQKDFLTKINKIQKIKRSDVSVSNKETLFFLKSKGYIAQKGFPNEDELFYVITATGKAELSKIKSDSIRFKLPLSISIIALIISIAHFVLSVLGII